MQPEKDTAESDGLAAAVALTGLIAAGLSGLWELASGTVGTGAWGIVAGMGLLICVQSLLSAVAFWAVGAAVRHIDVFRHVMRTSMAFGAVLLGASVAGLAMLVGGHLIERATDPSLRLQLWAVYGAVVAALCAAVALLAMRLAGWLERRFESGLTVLLAGLGSALGGLAWIERLLLFQLEALVWFGSLCLWAVLWAGMTLLLANSTVAVSRLSPFCRLGRRAWTWALLCAMGLGLAQGASLAAPGDLGQLASSNTLSGIATRSIRRLSDLDGDGYSALLAGGDCNDFDAGMNPGARDLQGNGIDEDCDGADARQVSAASRALSPYAVENPKPTRKNLIFITIDAMRADHVSFAGYRRRTTPNLDRLARKSWYFFECISPSSTTRESIPAVFTGRYPSGIKWTRRPKIWQIAREQYLLQEQLAKAGYQTIAIVDEWLDKFLPCFKRGFEHWEVPYGPGKWYRYGQHDGPYKAYAAIAALANRDKKRPFFLYVHFESPHHPYVRHPEVANFGNTPRDRYDAEIAYADHYLGLLLEYIETRHLLKDTIIVLFADHGEEFGEHGKFQHSRQLFRESVHVPLLIYVDGRHESLRQRVSLVDIYPTVMDLLGLRRPEARPQGISLLYYVRRGITWDDRLIFSELMVNCEGPMKFKEAIYRGNYKLLWDMDTNRLSLYDLRSDPGERRPIENQDVQKELFAMLKDFVMSGDHRPTN